jgi:hypothetical protein
VSVLETWKDKLMRISKLWMAGLSLGLLAAGSAPANAAPG